MAPELRILMATYQGGPHLAAQLASFSAQTHAAWTLWASDDGSSDETAALLRGFAAQAAQPVRLLDGPGQGAAQNFLSLLAHPDLGPGYTALSDQDDVWLPEKLARALAWLEPHSGADAGPALYASASLLTGPTLNDPRPSPVPRRPLGFGNALLQNVLAGNTIVLNPAATALAQAALPAAQAADVPFHDWWLYQVMTGAGARILLDPAPGLYYRQHGQNVLGENRSPRARLRRGLMAVNGVYSGWLTRNLTALEAVPLTAENRTLAAGFAALRGLRGRKAVATFDRLGLYRQSQASTQAMRGLALVGRL